MLKMDKYYYSDAMFQLEINLHKVRKELITMIEFSEQTDCPNCLLLKCTCTKEIKTSSDNKPKNKESSGSKDIAHSSLLPLVLPKLKCDKNKESPAPSTPEKDTVDQDIVDWMDASKKAEGHPKKPMEVPVMNQKRSLVTIESVRPADSSTLKGCLKTSAIYNSFNYINNNNNLQAFFKYFKQQNDNTKVIYTSAKLAAACSNKVTQNYTYF